LAVEEPTVNGTTLDDLSSNLVELHAAKQEISAIKKQCLINDMVDPFVFYLRSKSDIPMGFAKKKTYHKRAS
jgi:hypothetical protein